MPVRSICLFFLALLACSPALSAEPTLMLLQNSKLYGQQTVYVSKTVLRQIRPSKGLDTVINVQSGEVYVLNNAYHIFYRAPLKQFQADQGMRLSVLSGYLADLPMKEGAAGESVSGIAARRYNMPPGHEGEKAGRVDTDKPFCFGESSMRNVQMWTSRDIQLDPRIQKFVHELYQMPPVPGIPLRLTFTDVRDKDVVELNTVRAVRSAADIALPKAPAGYTMGRSLSEVINPHSSKFLYFEEFSRHKLGGPVNR